MTPQIELVSLHGCWNGTVGFYKHASPTTKTNMNFSVFLPPQAKTKPVPVLYWLSGLTCTEENFMVKSGAQKFAAEHGIALVNPDTSPRGANVPGESESWDFGIGAGFYVDATEAPWKENYQMFSYVATEFPQIINKNFPIDPKRISISGHSMGGHGALVLALRFPGRFKSVSAFAPICAPSRCPWGQKAFGNYLGQDRSAWAVYDTTSLITQSKNRQELLVDQGSDDKYINDELKPELLRQACEAAGVPLQLRVHPGYDHGYYFVSTFIGEHIAYHAKWLSTC